MKNIIIFIAFLSVSFNCYSLAPIKSLSTLELKSQIQSNLYALSKIVASKISASKEISSDLKKVLFSIYSDLTLAQDMSAHFTMRELLTLVQKKIIGLEAAIASQPSDCDKRSFCHTLDDAYIDYPYFWFLDSPLHAASPKKVKIEPLDIEILTTWELSSNISLILESA